MDIFFHSCKGVLQICCITLALSDTALSPQTICHESHVTCHGDAVFGVTIV